jgi:hypothetical protein
LLPYSAIEQALWELKIKYKKRLFDPIVTLWAFLSQVLDPDKSCHNAVSKIIVSLTGEGVEIPSTDTSAYCQALLWVWMFCDVKPLQWYAKKFMLICSLIIYFVV